MLLRIARVWEQGRDDELARYEQWCDCADTEADRAALKRLLDDRNPALADRIDALHAPGSACSRRSARCTWSARSACHC